VEVLKRGDDVDAIHRAQDAHGGGGGVIACIIRDQRNKGNRPARPRAFGRECHDEIRVQRNFVRAAAPAFFAEMTA
jgi:hypothetical protein